jgi:hypothetical protein
MELYFLPTILLDVVLIDRGEFVFAQRSGMAVRANIGEM